MAFPDRAEAGRVLGRKLQAYAGRDDVLVLALPRGGVPVAEQVARAITVPLDVFAVRKLGAPGHEELAVGAIASGGVQVVQEDTLRALGVSERELAEIIVKEEKELERRERAYRGDRPPLEIRGRTVLLVDDGLATGATMRAAIEALRRRGAGRVVVAVPVGSRESCAELARHADDVVCAITPEPFFGVGLWYEDFSQTTDGEVRASLARAARALAAARAARSGVRSSGELSDHVVDAVRRAAMPLGDPEAEELLLARAGRARFVLIGEASHGTHEFYAYRARLTRRLVAEHGFAAVAVEASWPDAYRVHRYVRGEPEDRDADRALCAFAHFPSWMWRNADVLEFVTWLRRWNDSLPARSPRVGFYGLDLYSLHTSMAVVIRYLEQIDPAAAARARERYSCFDHVSDDGQAYGFSAGLGLSRSCEQEVLAQLLELRERARAAAGAIPLGEDERFSAEQNALVARNAEAYYRSLFRGRVSSWNLRDEHMMETLAALERHLAARGDPPRLVVWAHNSHLGDARATDMAAAGEINLGQLARERYGSEVVLIGFTTYAGTVTAASDWGGPTERKAVRPALPRSYEALLHEVGIPELLVPLWQRGPEAEALRESRLERAIGVIYRPESERVSHYFHADLPAQFDAVIHIDQTRGVEPLEREALGAQDEVPETYPSAV